MAAGEIRIGTSGWIYPHWVGGFYPRTVRAKDRFAHYASQFDTVEINGSFYRLPSEKAVAAWAAMAPPGFLFSWKASQYITHAKKLRDAAASVALVTGRMAPLGAHMGPALFQLPPVLKRDDTRLADFLPLLPPGLRCTVEFRHPSWFDDAVFDLLARYGVALCIGDHHHAPAPWLATAPFVYVRGHGPGGVYSGRYGADELAAWAERIAGWAQAGRPVFAYFDNDIGGAAPLDAHALKALLAAPAASGAARSR